MTAKFLHVEIREKGGAYGGGARLSHGGIFTLFSYRWGSGCRRPWGGGVCHWVTGPSVSGVISCRANSRKVAFADVTASACAHPQQGPFSSQVLGTAGGDRKPGP